MSQSANTTHPTISSATQHQTGPHHAANEVVQNEHAVVGEKPMGKTRPQCSVVYESIQPGIADPTKRKNVVIFGETGVGKSSVINLIAGREVADTSSDLTGCTESATAYMFTVDGVPLRIHDTVGLEEPETRTNTAFFRAIENACQLIRTLNSAGGVDLFLFCINGGRITAGTQRSHRLFSEFLCEKKIPLAVVATHLETEDNMDNWWLQNKAALRRYGINPVAHACITSSTADRDAEKREQSQKAVRQLLSETLANSESPSLFDPRKWILDIILRMRDLLQSLKPKGVNDRDLATRIAGRCSLSAEDAMQVANIVLGRGDN